MSPTGYNGAAIIAMRGKNCVAIASDLRFGVQLCTMAMDMPKVYKVHDTCYVGLSGLVTDMQTLSDRFKFRHNMYKLREERDMKPSTFANFVSNMLYEKRFGPYFCEPVIAGLEPDGTPYITGMDLIGAMAPADNFIVSGTSNESLLGACESLYKDDLGPEELFEVISQSMLAALGRDSMSGWGAVVNVITMDGVITRTIKTRMD